MYTRHSDIQANIPRGMTLLVTKPKVGEEGSLGDHCTDVVIFANRKFTGGIGDEDDEQPNTDEEWKKFFLKPSEEASLVASTEKVNGEAAHFSGRCV